MAVFKKITKIDNQPRTIIQPTEKDDRRIVGQLFSSVPFGVLPLNDEGTSEFPILESFDRAADHVGEKGTVYVYDPDDLWQPEWPELS